MSKIGFQANNFFCINHCYEKRSKYVWQRNCTVSSEMVLQEFSYNRTTEARVVLKKRCSENMQQIYRRILMPTCDFNNVAKQLYWNRTSAWVLSCKFAAYFPFPRSTSGWLPLELLLPALHYLSFQALISLYHIPF